MNISPTVSPPGEWRQAGEIPCIDLVQWASWAALGWVMSHRC